jgi:hypothetical protein
MDLFLIRIIFQGWYVFNWNSTERLIDIFICSDTFNE